MRQPFKRYSAGEDLDDFDGHITLFLDAFSADHVDDYIMETFSLAGNTRLIVLTRSGPRVRISSHLAAPYTAVMGHGFVSQAG